MNDTYRQFLEIKQERCAGLKKQLEALYPDPVDLTLEVGCGHGHYLTAFAQSQPEEFCLGVDLVTKRIAKANAKKNKRNLRNLTFIKAEIRELMGQLPATVRLKRVFILFPDPWPKKRHAKNRIIQTELLSDIANRADPETRLHFRTDHEGQFAWGLEKIASHPNWKIDDEEPWPLEKGSFFQDMMDNYFSLTAVRIIPTNPGSE